MIEKTKNISAVIIYATDYETVPSLKKLFDAARSSVSWCSEIVLVNGTKGSFNDWRNEGLKKAKSDWVLYLDSDEEVTPALRDEIVNMISSGSATNNYYAIPRQNIIFNKKFKHSGQYPDYQKRLFKRKYLSRWIGEVHEEPVVEGAIGYVTNPIIHHKNMTLTEMVEKTNKWSEIESKLMFEANHPPMNIFRFMSAGFREFVLRFVKQKAFLDGREGIIYGIYQIYSKLISYSKLWEKQQSTIHT